jgi:hypothetical protein
MVDIFALIKMRVFDLNMSLTEASKLIFEDRNVLASILSNHRAISEKSFARMVRKLSVDKESNLMHLFILGYLYYAFPMDAEHFLRRGRFLSFNSVEWSLVERSLKSEVIQEKSVRFQFPEISKTPGTYERRCQILKYMLSRKENIVMFGRGRVLVQDMKANVDLCRLCSYSLIRGDMRSLASVDLVKPFSSKGMQKGLEGKDHMHHFCSWSLTNKGLKIAKKLK